MGPIPTIRRPMVLKVCFEMPLLRKWLYYLQWCFIFYNIRIIVVLVVVVIVFHFPLLRRYRIGRKWVYGTYYYVHIPIVIIHISYLKSYSSYPKYRQHSNRIPIRCIIMIMIVPYLSGRRTHSFFNTVKNLKIDLAIEFYTSSHFLHVMHHSSYFFISYSTPSLFFPTDQEF